MLEYCDKVTMRSLDPSAPPYRWRIYTNDLNVRGTTLHYNGSNHWYPGVRAVRAYASRYRSPRVLMCNGEQYLSVNPWCPPCPIPKEEDDWDLDAFLTLINDGTAENI